MSQTWIPEAAFARLTDLRVRQPELVRELAAARRRRSSLAPDGRLVIIAADHPARHVHRVGDDPLAMANRAVYLDRIVRVLSHSEIDGLMASPDILDEVFLLNHLRMQAGAPDMLAEKVLVGCLNRGGLAGAAWELDDFVTGHTPEAAAALGLDGLKMLLRVSLSEPASARTLAYCARALDRASALGLPVFVEPLPVAPGEGGWRVVKTAAAVVPLVGVTTALGPSSARMWLKLPMLAEGMAQVAAATTCPILLLGGESAGDPAGLLQAIARAMAAGPNVRGLMIGRSVLFPAPGVDPRAVAVAAARVVRGRWSAQEAAARLPELREEEA